MTIRLALLGRNDLMRVAHITVAPHQIKYSGTVQEAFEDAEDGIDFHAIVQNEQPVGFFKIDNGYPDQYPFAPDGSIGLRAFMIDHNLQGRGIATRAVSMMPTYLAQQYRASSVYLTVNMSNPAAIGCYLKGGFTDTGAVWEKGIAGPQHVMYMALA